MEPSPHKLHERAFESAKETRQLLVTMATGSLGVYFLALTGTAPVLTYIQKITIILAMIEMAITIFCGILGAYSDAQWSYYWAKEIEERQLNFDVMKRSRNKQYWHRHKRWSERMMMLLFSIGILTSCVFIISKTLQ